MKTLLLVGGILVMTVCFSAAEDEEWKKVDYSESEERWLRLKRQPSFPFSFQDKPDRNIPRPYYPRPFLNIPRPYTINPEHQFAYVFPNLKFQIPSVFPFPLEFLPPFYPFVHPIYYGPQTSTPPRNPTVTSQTPQPPVDSSANTPESATAAPVTATPMAQTPLQP
ncbi:leucine-rich repeat extensin-like protein 2 isoform X1 [Tachyglossus aculeatus]|uniref:leucine-rich repeat extensin-like protein 2 isoform X1 n=1 Tax=Tachyglossus aculeatus TaxID=9261 RepID=UPI0018F2AB7E|nr:leucine-rich repeat extensin-like protein 2 isoform X1 [Tachyglossus aculeatus]